jgi:hypothetical protein
MNVLPFDKQVQVIAAITEGCSIRSTERLTGVNRNTAMSQDFESAKAVRVSMTA